MTHFKKIILILSVMAVTSVTAIAQKFDRGLDFTQAPVFMPKGQMMVGGTISYQDFKFQDYKFIILNNMNLSAYSMKVTPYLYYSFYKNMAVGAKFSYQRMMAEIVSTDLSISADMSFGVEDYFYIQHSYFGSLSYRYFMPLGQSKVFGVFADVSLNAGFGQGKMTSGSGHTMTGTYQQILDLGIDFVPGLIVFVANEMAIEASIGILGLGWKRVSQTTNQIYEGVFETSSANFKLNFLSINIGIDFVIPVAKDKKSVKPVKKS